MDEESSNKGLWAGLTIAVLAAIVFLVLWYLRGGEIDRLNTTLRTAQASASSTAQSLESDLRTTRNSLDDSNQRISELEAQVRDEQRRTTDAVQQAERRLRGDVDSANARIRTLTRDLEQARAAADQGAADELRAQFEELRASGETRISDLSARLEAARRTITKLESGIRERDAELEARSGAADTSGTEDGAEARDLRVELARMETALSGAQNANAALEELRNRLATLLDAERAKVAELRKSLADIPDDPAQEWRQKAQDLELELSKLRESQTSLANRNDNLRKQLGASEEKLKEEVERVEAVGRSRLKSREEELNALLREADKRLKDREQELRNQFDREKAELEKRLEEATQSAPTAERERSEPVVIPAPAPDDGSGARGLSVTAAAPQVQEPVRSATLASGVTVKSGALSAAGRVVEVMADGRTYLINGGTRERVGPGMKFDVHRPDGNRARFIGVLKVVKSMDHYSLAVPVETEAVMICPVTGRAVLEPGARLSPFAVAEDGKPVPLVRAEEPAALREVPVIGDYIDNPFYSPARRIVFAVAPELAANAVELVEILGGIACIGDSVPPSADYLVAAQSLAFSGDPRQPRRASVAHLAAYAEN